jgi:hypothetical protein
MLDAKILSCHFLEALHTWVKERKSGKERWPAIWGVTIWRICDTSRDRYVIERILIAGPMSSILLTLLSYSGVRFEVGVALISIVDDLPRTSLLCSSVDMMFYDLLQKCARDFSIDRCIRTSNLVMVRSRPRGRIEGSPAMGQSQNSRILIIICQINQLFFASQAKCDYVQAK